MDNEYWQMCSDDLQLEIKGRYCPIYIKIKSVGGQKKLSDLSLIRVTPQKPFYRCIMYKVLPYTNL